MPSSVRKTKRKSKSKSVSRSPKKRSTTRRRRAKSSERYTNIVGEKIGEGGFGSVSRPPARCAKFYSANSKNINQRNVNSVVFQETYYKNKKYVSKITEYLSAQKELEIGIVIKSKITNWKDFFCLIEFMCEAPTDKQYRNNEGDIYDTYGISPYGGITLDSILREDVYLNPRELCCLIEALKYLITGLVQLHRKQIYHQDIHPGNILYNPTDRKLRFIDFGLALDLSKLDRFDSACTKAHLMDLEQLMEVIRDTLGVVAYVLESAKYRHKEEYHECYKYAIDCLDDIPEIDDFATNRDKLKILVDYVNRFLGDFEPYHFCKKVTAVTAANAVTTSNAVGVKKGNNSNSAKGTRSRSHSGNKK